MLLALLSPPPTPFSPPLPLPPTHHAPCSNTLQDITNAGPSSSASGAAVKPTTKPTTTTSRVPTRPTEAKTTSSNSYQHSGQVDNIDLRDAGDPLCATEYVGEMYEHFRGMEAEKSTRPGYMETQR